MADVGIINVSHFWHAFLLLPYVFSTPPPCDIQYIYATILPRVNKGQPRMIESVSVFHAPLFIMRV